MNFDELQDLWAGAKPVAAPSSAPASSPRFLLTAFKRRQRLLTYEAASFVAGLILAPLLSVVNFLHRPDASTPLYWTAAVLHFVVLSGCTVLVFRRLKRHRDLARARAGTVRAQAESTLASLEAERRDFRSLPWLFALWIGLSLLSIAANTPFHGGSFEAVALRVGMVAGFSVLAGAVLWRDYRVNILPALTRQQEILRQLD